MDLTAGQKAPRLTVSLSGGRTATIPAVGRPQLLFFFKVACPTCPLAAPSVEQLRRGYSQAPTPLDVLCVAQDEPEETSTWMRENGLAGEVAFDGPFFPASAAFGLLVVPSLVLIDAQGGIVATEEGFSRDGYNALSLAASRLTGAPYWPVAGPGDGRPAFRPG